MDPNENDEVFAREPELDEQARSRANGKAHALRKRPQAVPEQAPLLGDAVNSRRSSFDSDNESEPVEWFGTAELQGLPWWKRPSVRLLVQHHELPEY